jgi:UDP-N-acetylmuramoylalanine--D-glutamate ligase
VRLYGPGFDLRGSRVLVMGLGTKDGGVGAALFAHGAGALVTVTDLKPAGELEHPLAVLGGLGISMVLGGHREEDFLAADLVIRNPGIRRSNPFLRAASDAGAAVDSPAGIFCERIAGPWVGITGTKGKSYTTHLASHLLACSGIPSVAAGNNCVSPLRTVDDPSLRHVVELSSWQLSEMGLHGRSPQVGCWLNLFPDHMNWYGSMEEYRRDKEKIFDNQGEDGVAVVPLADPSIASVPHGSGKLLFGQGDGGGADGCFLDGGRLIYREGGTAVTVALADSLPPELRAGPHMDLVPPAVCCAAASGADPGRLRGALRSFGGLPCRFQTVLERGGLRVVNDSAATTPESVVRALESMGDSAVVLIAGGGGHKNLDYGTLADRIAERVSGLVLFEGDGASRRLSDELAGRMDGRLHTAADMDEAVAAGLGLSRKATLILSPGCSGAPFFVDLFERGRQFMEALEARTGG